MMVGGEIIANEPEAAAVRKVFCLYLSGVSLQDISGAMIVPYNDSVNWDKHKVKRILDNSKYIGMDGYPKLIDERDFLAAGRLKPGKCVSSPLPCSQEIQLLKAVAVCSECGKRFIRKPNRHGNARWRCLNQHCSSKISLLDDDLKHIVNALLNDIIRNSALLKASQPNHQEPIAVIKLQNEVNQEMSKARPGADTQKLLLSLSAEKYTACNDTHSTLAIREIFEKHEPADQFNCGLFVAAVGKVLVSRDAHITLRLKNGQVLPGPD